MEGATAKSMKQMISGWKCAVKKQHEDNLRGTGGGATKSLKTWQETLNDLRLGGRKTHRVGFS